MRIMRDFLRQFVSPGAWRFYRYASIGFLTFAFDLAILVFAVEYLRIPFYLATPLCFVIAVSINYVLSRLHVFRGSTRSLHMGYAYFLASAGLGAFLSTSGVAFFVLAFGIHYLPARVMVAAVVGCANYLFNLRFNFKVMGMHP